VFVNYGANCLLKLFQDQFKQAMRDSLFILENSFVPFFPNIPDNDAWHKGPSQIKEHMLCKVSSPLV